jgi:hypothetical protein
VWFLIHTRDKLVLRTQRVAAGLLSTFLHRLHEVAIAIDERNAGAPQPDREQRQFLHLPQPVQSVAEIGIPELMEWNTR